MKRSLGAPTSASASAATVATTVPSLKTNAASIDWAVAGKVTPVKNQGNCGSCWAFAAVAMLESGILFKNGTTILFSEQNIVDCCGYNKASQCKRSDGCNGGWSEDALQYVAALGIAKSAAYPYVATTNACKSTILRYKIISATVPYANITMNSVAAIQTALNTKTVGVGVYADTWYLYKSGIFSNCPTTVGYNDLDHMVLLVGYNSTSWKIKNQWGTTWGIAGYMYLPLTGKNCGILLEAITTTML